TTSHYGAVYNVLFFNDGYHVEHHAHPTRHWSTLPDARDPAATSSAWPAALRWTESIGLEALECLVLRSRLLERFVLRTHTLALRPLLAELPRAASVGIVGGGLFPRTAIILRELLPASRMTVIDRSRANLEVARERLHDEAIDWRHACFEDEDAA